LTQGKSFAYTSLSFFLSLKYDRQGESGAVISRRSHRSPPLFALIFLVLFCSGLFAFQGEGVPSGEFLQPFTLPVPESDQDRRTLGLTDEGFFPLSKLPSKFVLIEFFGVL